MSKRNPDRAKPLTDMAFSKSMRDLMQLWGDFPDGKDVGEEVKIEAVRASFQIAHTIS